MQDASLVSIVLIRRGIDIGLPSDSRSLMFGTSPVGVDDVVVVYKAM